MIRCLTTTTEKPLLLRGVFFRKLFELNLATKPSTPIWLVLWSVALGATWLLPNHTPPWATFHSEAWAALLMLLALLSVFLRTQGPVRWHAMPLAVLVLLPVPMLQHWFGQVPFIGGRFQNTTQLSRGASLATAFLQGNLELTRDLQHGV